MNVAHGQETWCTLQTITTTDPHDQDNLIYMETEGASSILPTVVPEPTATHANGL